MTNTAPPIWRESYTIRSYETDQTGRARIQALCNYLQEAAGNHARALSLSTEHFENLTWFLTRFRIEFSRIPDWREEVRVTTWPSGHNKLYATRDFLLTDADDRPCAKATSYWLLVEITRRRPVRLPAGVMDLRLSDRQRVLEKIPAAIPDLPETQFSELFTVRWSDLDLNRHVNNVRYIEWALETLYRNRDQHPSLKTLDTVFKSEMGFKEQVLAEAGRANTGSDIETWIHRLSHEPTGKEVARALTEWTSAP